MSTRSPRPVIQCPHCGKDVPLDEALAHQLAAPLRARWEEEVRQQVGDEVRSAYAKDVADQKAKLKLLQDQLEERASEIKVLRDQEAELRKAKRALDDEKAEWDLERERMRDEISKQEREKATKLADERAALDLSRKERDLQEQQRQTIDGYETTIRELKTQLERVNKELAETQRKARTGSATEEGYARQDLFAEELQRRFPGDEVVPVRRGQAGADVTQVVRSRGADCGTILWEVKRAANWQAGWPAKLASDRDKAGALIGVIVSESLPADVDSFGRVGDVWVCGFTDAVAVGGVLREMVITVWRHEIAAAERAGSAEKVYNYVMTGSFGRRFEALGRLALGLLRDLEQDKRALDQRWKRTERRIREILDVRDAIPADLIDAVGADVELPAPLRAEFPADTVAELPRPSDSPAIALEPAAGQG